MKRNTKIILAAASVIVIATGTVAAAAGGHGRMSDRMVSKLTDRLELDVVQATALETLHTELKETRDLMRGNIDTQADTLKQLITAESFDQGAALEMITQRTTAMQAQGPEVVAAAAQFLDALNSEQKQELSELMQRFSDRRGGRHHRDN